MACYLPPPISKERYLLIKSAILAARDGDTFTAGEMAERTGYPITEIDFVLEEMCIEFSLIENKTYTWLDYDGGDDGY